MDILLPNGTATLRAVGIVKKDGPGLLNSGAVAFVPIDVVQELFARGGELDQIDIVATAEASSSTQKLTALRAALRDKLGNKFLVNYPAQRGQIVTQQLATYQQGLSFFSMIALFVGGFLIYNAFTMTIVERTQEIGLLRALGVSRRQMLRLVMIEAALLGVIGSIFGVIFGLIMAQGLIALMATITATEIVTVSIPADGLFTALLVGLGVTLISSLLPAWRATRISPLAALRIKGREDPAGAPRKLGFVAGAEFVIVGMLFVYAIPLRDSVVFQVGSLAVFVMLLGATLMVPVSLDFMEKFVRPIISRLFGREGLIGAGNIQRSRGRTSLTVAALMVGVSMVISIGAMSRSFQKDIDAWVDTSVGGDLIVRSPLHMQIGFRIAPRRDSGRGGRDAGALLRREARGRRIRRSGAGLSGARSADVLGRGVVPVFGRQGTAAADQTGLCGRRPAGLDHGGRSLQIEARRHVRVGDAARRAVVSRRGHRQRFHRAGLRASTDRWT